MKYITLTKGYKVRVDDVDYYALSRFKWYVSESRKGAPKYACRRKGSVKVSMHRELLNAPKGIEVDHIDGNGLNNCKSTLRLATRSENARNMPKRPSKMPYRGVIQMCATGYIARITCNKKVFNVGYFKDPISAAKAYDKKAKELHGKFARLNFK